MARSPLTLAASVTSALPRVGVVGAGALSEGAAGRFDSAVAQLDDGRRVVVRAPADPDAATELAAEVRALRALTPGVRGLLPFRAPELLGEAGLGDSRVVVVDFLPGYRVDAAHLPREKVQTLYESARETSGGTVTGRNLQPTMQAVTRLIFGAPEFQFC